MLNDLIKTKKELRFKNGKFKIVLFTDIHGKMTFDRRTVKCLEVITEKFKPDLILLGGDNVCGDDCLPTEQLFRNSFNDVANIFESRKIPWAHVYGNHDDEIGLTPEEQQHIYESYEYCVSKRGPRDIHGVGNYMLPIKDSEGEKIKFNVWGMDSLHISSSINGNKTVLKNHFGDGSGASHCRADQIAWYWNASKLLEEHCGEKIPSIMYFHKPIFEFNLIVKNTVETHMYGEHREEICAPEFNYGLLSFAAERGDVKGIYCGHDHSNNFEGTYAGIHLGYCGGLGYNIGMHPFMRGCRIFEIDESNPALYKTYIYKVMEDETLASIPGMLEVV